MMTTLWTALLAAAIAAVPTVAWALVFASTDVPKSIPDPGFVESTLSVPASVTLTDVNVTLTIEHTFVSDLRILLIGPDLTTIVDLSSNNDFSGDNYTNTTFDDSAATSITAGTPPYTGSFRPEQPLSVFNGTEGQGVWKLRIEDQASEDAGRLVSWSIDILPERATDVPEPVTLTLLGAGLAALGFLGRRRNRS